jgi:ribosomal protein L9
VIPSIAENTTSFSIKKGLATQTQPQQQHQQQKWRKREEEEEEEKTTKPRD